MTDEYQIRVVPEVAAQEDRLKSWLADEYGFDVRTIQGVRILKRSSLMMMHMLEQTIRMWKGTLR